MASVDSGWSCHRRHGWTSVILAQGKYIVLVSFIEKKNLFEKWFSAERLRQQRLESLETSIQQVQVNLETTGIM